MKKNTIYIISGIVGILVVAAFVLWFPTPKRKCISQGGRYIDGACRVNNVCPMPFYDVGPVDPSTGFNFECGVPNSIKGRIGSTYKSGDHHVIMTVNAPGDHFKTSDEVKDFWMKQGYMNSEINVGGGAGSTSACPAPGSCAGNKAWFYQQQDDDMCTYFLADTQLANARLTTSGQGSEYDIDGVSFSALGRCDTSQCSDSSCRIPRTQNVGTTFLIKSYQ